MAIDAMIPLMAKGIDGMQVLENGSKMAQMWQQDRANQELNRIYNESQGDVGKMLTLGQQSKMARYIVPQIQAQQAAQQKAALDLQKTQAEIKNIDANAGKTLFDTNSSKLGMIQSAIGSGAQSGDKRPVKDVLEYMLKTGSITPDQFTLINGQVDSFEKPEDFKAYATTMLKPEFWMQSANSIADNQTQVRIADENRRFNYDKLGQDADQFLAQYIQGENHFGTTMNLERLKMDLQNQNSSKEKPEQKIDRINSAISAADATAQAARAARDASSLIKHPGLNLGTGLTSALGLVPSSDAKDFQARLENLKSQVFLPTVKAMQGMGALSNAEGEKIASAVANLDPRLSPDAMRQQLTVLAQQMANAAEKAKKQTLNYATRGGTIKLNTQSQGKASSGGKVYTDAMVREYARQSGMSVQEVTQIIKQSGGAIR